MGRKQHSDDEIRDALRETGGNRKDAAKAMGCSPQTLRERMRDMTDIPPGAKGGRPRIDPAIEKEVRKLLDANKLSQRAIAERVGISRSAVQRIATMALQPPSVEPPGVAPTGKCRKCPTCHHLVKMPCLACRIRARPRWSSDLPEPSEHDGLALRLEAGERERYDEASRCKSVEAEDIEDSEHPTIYPEDVHPRPRHHGYETPEGGWPRIDMDESD